MDGHGLSLGASADDLLMDWLCGIKETIKILDPRFGAEQPRRCGTSYGDG